MGGTPVFLFELAGPELVVTSATSGAAAALGSGPPDLTGCRLADVVGEPGGRQLVETVRRVFVTGRHERDVPWRVPPGAGSGEPGPGFSLSVVPVCRPDGSPGGVAVTGLARGSQLPGRRGPDAAARAVPGGGPGGRSPGGRLDPAGARAPGIPSGLPVLPGVRLAARCLAARRGPFAGDAWVDAVVLPHGVLALMAGMASGPSRDVAACVAQLDPASGGLRYASAGHPRPLLCTPAGEASFLPAPGGALPGGAGHPGATAETVLPRGGVLVLYAAPAASPGHGASPADGGRRLTDLVASVMAGSDEAAAAGPADRIAAAVAEQLAQWSDGGDVVVLAAHRLREPAGEWSMEFPADPRALSGLREGLGGWLEDLGVAESDRADVELAVWEASVNAAVHGRPRLGTGTVRVRAALDDSGNAVIRVSDRGRWRVGKSLASGRAWAGGRGLSVISQVMDELSISPGPAGTTITMRRILRRPAVTS